MKTKLNGLLAAGLLVLLANGFVFVQVARNRAATPVAEFELTDRELRLLPRGEDDSGVGLSLIYMNPAPYRDMNLGPNRKVFLALEYDGPAWRDWRDHPDRPVPGLGARHLEPDTIEQSSHLMLIEVGPDAAALRRKYPDTRKVIILPGAARGTGERAWARLEVTEIHVPLPESIALKGAAHYRVRLRQEPSLELWVAGVERIVG
jgi:hypothetical protein